MGLIGFRHPVSDRVWCWHNVRGWLRWRAWTRWGSLPRIRASEVADSPVDWRGTGGSIRMALRIMRTDGSGADVALHQPDAQ